MCADSNNDKKSKMECIKKAFTLVRQSLLKSIGKCSADSEKSIVVSQEENFVGNNDKKQQDLNSVVERLITTQIDYKRCAIKKTRAMFVRQCKSKGISADSAAELLADPKKVERIIDEVYQSILDKRSTATRNVIIGLGCTVAGLVTDKLYQSYHVSDEMRALEELRKEISGINATVSTIRLIIIDSQKFDLEVNGTLVRIENAVKEVQNGTLFRNQDNSSQPINRDKMNCGDNSNFSIRSDEKAIPIRKKAALGNGKRNQQHLNMLH